MKTPTSDKEAISTSHSKERKCRRAKKFHREEDRSVEHPSMTQQDQATNSLASREVPSWSVEQLSEPTHPPKEKYTTTHNNRFEAHFRTSTSFQSEIFPKTLKHQYYQPQADQETYTINAKGHLQCNQYFNKVIQAPTPQNLPGSREYPIFHEPGSIQVKSVEDLLTLYPNSFDSLGSLKGEYDIKSGSNSATSTTCQKKGAN